MRAPNGLDTCFREPEVLHLALLDEVLYGPGDILDRNFVVNSMLIEQIDDIGPKTLERGLGNFFDVLWTAVQDGLLSIFDLKSELGGDYHLLTKWLESFPDQFFICVRAIDFGCVEEG